MNRVSKAVMAIIIATGFLFAVAACGKNGTTGTESDAFNKAKADMQGTGNVENTSADPDTEGVSMGEVNTQQAGLIAIKELLYTDEYDEEYLTPDSEDYEVIVYEVPVVYLVSDYTVYRDAYGVPEGFGLPRSGNEYKTSCTYIKVISYGTGREILSVKEKLDYPDEKDALRPYLAALSENWVMFDNGVIPDDFDEEEAVRKIVDETVPAYFSSVSDGTSITRKGSVWYGQKADSSSGYNLTDLAQISLRDNTKDFKAKSTNDIGINSFDISYETSSDEVCHVTTYYSFPEYHGKRLYDDYTLETIGQRFNNPDDEKYFKPVTDDYLYYLRNDGGDSDLMSFDEQGNLVQWVNRRDDEPNGYANMLYDETFEPYMTKSADYKAEYEDILRMASDTGYIRESSDSGRTIKWEYIYDFYYSLYYSTENGQLIMSKGLSEDDTRLTNEESPMFEKMKELVPPGEDDYLLEINEDKYESEANVSGGKMYHDAIGYYYANLYIFDEDGYEKRYIRMQIFDDPSMIEEELKRTFGTKLDDSGNIVINDEYYEPAREKYDPQTKGSIYYWDLPCEDYHKWECGQYEGDGELRYFSKPYLTTKQLEAMDAYYN